MDWLALLLGPFPLRRNKARSVVYIPIVAVTGDPLRSGMVTSLARPGGNITGVSLMAIELHGKCVELLHDLLPSVRRVAGLFNADDPSWKPIQEYVQLAGKDTGIEISPSSMVRGPGEIDLTLAAMKRKRAEAVVVQGSLATKDVAELALKHRYRRPPSHAHSLRLAA